MFRADCIFDGDTPMFLDIQIGTKYSPMTLCKQSDCNKSGDNLCCNFHIRQSVQDIPI